MTYVLPMKSGFNGSETILRKQYKCCTVGDRDGPVDGRGVRNVGRAEYTWSIETIENTEKERSAENGCEVT